MYAAAVTMVVSATDGGTNDASAYQGGMLSQARVKSYANLVASDRIASMVVSRLHLNESPDVLRSRITTQAVPDTVLLRVSVRDPVPARAERLANAVGDAFSAAVAQIETPATGQQPTVRVTVWEDAKLPTGPVSPRPARNLALGLLLGLVAGLGVALVRHRLDTTLTGQQDLAAISDRPALGSIVFESAAGRRPLIVHTSPHSPRAEAFRQLRTNLRFVDVDGVPRSIVVTSSVPAEGKSTTSCNLAITLAQSGARVCLVEGDLRRPSFAEYLGVEAAAGLTSVLIGAAGLEDVLQPWGEGRFGSGAVDVLPSGPIPPNPSELLGSRGMADLVVRLTEIYDIVLIDAPPLLPVTDAAVLASRADGTLLVVRIGRTRREQVRRAMETLRAVDARVLGTVLNMVPIKGLAGRGYGGYYGGYLLTRGRHARLDTPGDAMSGDPSAPGGAPEQPVRLTSMVEQRSSEENLPTRATER
jgi:non-specific protein-tyrosine kinase